MNNNDVRIFTASFGSRIPEISMDELGVKMSTMQAVAARRFDWFEQLQKEDAKAGVNEVVAYTHGACMRGFEHQDMSNEIREWNVEAITRTRKSYPDAERIWFSSSSILNSNGSENYTLQSLGTIKKQIEWAARRHEMQLRIAADYGATHGLGEAFPNLPEIIGYCVALDRCGLKGICSVEAPHGVIPGEESPTTFEIAKAMIEKYVHGSIDSLGLGINCVSARACIGAAENNPVGTLASMHPNKNCFPTVALEQEFKKLAENFDRDETQEQQFQSMKGKYCITDDEIAQIIALRTSRLGYDGDGPVISICCGGTSADINRIVRLSKGEAVVK